MPRSFMITNRRYRTVVEYDSRDCSPEPADLYFLPFSMADKTPPSGGIVSGNTFDFYNRFHCLSGLEQLAEISLATAHRWNPSPPSSPETASSDVSSYSDSSQSSSSKNNNNRRLLFHRHHHKHRLHHQTAFDCQSSTDVTIHTADQPLSLVTKIKDCVEEDEEDEEEEERTKVDQPTKDTDENWDNCVIDKSDVKITNICPECGKRYSTSSNLARHRQTHRSMEDKKARKCPHCDKVYVSMPAYSMHVRTHNQGCQCPFCGKCYSRPWLLQGHIRTHTGEKPFKCQVCNKAFADKSNLRAHVQTHSDTKPFVCQRCGKAFALKSYLYKHEESSCMRAHATSGVPPQPKSVTSDAKR